MRLLLVAAVLALGTPREADACTCVPRSMAEHATAAKRVFLARAGKPNKTGDALKQTFTVLATFKGPSEKQFVFDRPATPPCATDYTQGQIAILFTSGGGDLGLCNGNVSFEEQAEELAEIVGATKVKTTAADVKATAVALDGALKGYQKPRKTDVKITKSFTTGALTFVRGTYKREGVRFAVALLRRDDGTWSVIYRDVVET